MSQRRSRWRKWKSRRRMRRYGVKLDICGGWSSSGNGGDRSARRSRGRKRSRSKRRGRKERREQRRQQERQRQHEREQQEEREQRREERRKQRRQQEKFERKQQEEREQRREQRRKERLLEKRHQEQQRRQKSSVPEPTIPEPTPTEPTPTPHLPKPTRVPVVELTLVKCALDITSDEIPAPGTSKDVVEETSSDTDMQTDSQQKEGEEGYSIAEIQENIHLIYEEYLAEKEEGSTDKFSFSKPMAEYMTGYQEHIFRPDGTQKVKENCISVSTRAKIFVMYLKMATPGPYWDWRFPKNTKATRAFPAILSKVGLKPTTMVGYLHNIYAFLGYFAKNLPKNCSLSTKTVEKTQLELRKLSRDSGRVIAAHQLQVKSNKELNLIPQTALSACQRLTLLLCWTGVFSKMTQKEVENAVGDEEKGYLVSVLQHKTVQTYGFAQIYMTAEEFTWCTRRLTLLRRGLVTNKFFLSSTGQGPIKDMRTYMGRAWVEMGLGDPPPTFIDIRTAVATLQMRRVFVALSLEEDSEPQQKSLPHAKSSCQTQEQPRRSSTPKKSPYKKRLREKKKPVPPRLLDKDPASWKLVLPIRDKLHLLDADPASSTLAPPTQRKPSFLKNLKHT
ncbi:hypothetical protein WMY93_030254 [Mugilogobius chulae]|uniref:Uncharacterized protein n=1 Tax=Mugilogobius chulae TaxID=88201 RepID=A0AAW0MP46_9GOBI